MEVGGRLDGGGQKEGKWDIGNSINNKTSKIELFLLNRAES